MNNFRGRVALITGGAHGIGLAMVRAFVDAGMKVAVADLDDDALVRVADEFSSPGQVVLPVRLDVTDRYMWAMATDRIEAALGPVQVLCCNAGVAGSQENLEDIGVGAWQWSFDVNVNGLLHGLRSVLPRMRHSGLEGHVVVTSSWHAFQTEARYGATAATQAAQVAMAETLRAELADSPIGVSLLCTGPVRTSLVANTQRGGRRVGVRVVTDGALVQQLAEGIDPADAASLVMRAIRRRQFWVFTHAELRRSYELRAREVMAGFQQAHSISLAADDD